MKVLINHITKNNEVCLLSLYPETRRAFLSVKIDDYTTLSYKSSQDKFEEALKKYFDIDFSTPPRTYPKAKSGSDCAVEVDIVTAILHRI